MNYHEVVAAIHRLELLRRIKAREAMTSVGLYPGQPPLLEYVRDHPGCTQKEAADELDVTPASAAASLKRLEKAGLVERNADEKDARCNRLSITQAGIDRTQAGRRLFDALDEKMCFGLTEEEIQTFHRVCEKMFDNLADDSCRHLTVWMLARRAHEEREEKKI